MSNFTGGNPARGTNKSHRNAMFRNPASFNSAVLPHGSLAFLVCAGNMRGAVHDGKTCGGVAHWPLFAPSADFGPLYDLLDAGGAEEPVAPAPVAPAPAPVQEREGSATVTTTSAKTAPQTSSTGTAPTPNAAVNNMFGG